MRVDEAEDPAEREHDFLWSSDLDALFLGSVKSELRGLASWLGNVRGLAFNWYYVRWNIAAFGGG